MFSLPDEESEEELSDFPAPNAPGGLPLLSRPMPPPAAYIAFLITACLLDFQRALALLVITCVVLVFLTYGLLKRLLGPRLRRCGKFQGHSRLSLWLKR